MRTMPRTHEDAPLVAASRRGERAAYETLVRRHARAAARLAHRLLGNREDAEDVVQDAFAKAFVNLGTFREEASFRTWLLHIVMHLCHDQLRRRERRGPTLGLDGVEPTTPDAGPGRDAQARDELRSLREAVDALPPRQRAALVLKVVEGLPYDEVARALGTTVESARVYLSLARQSIRRRVERAARRRGES
ncbi:MAG: RNA polymerase sigma factor [Planctomycetota bacterium JB042]